MMNNVDDRWNKMIDNHTPKPSRHFNSICYDDDDDDKEKTIPLRDIISQLPPSIVITTSFPVLPIEDSEDSLIMGMRNLALFLKKNQTNDDESLFDEDVLEDNVKVYLNPVFEFDDEYISSDVNPLLNEVLEDIKSKNFYDSNLDELALLVTPLFDSNKDECFNPGGDLDEINAFDISLDFEDGYYD
nr:hypothetical protein [Tanacetum cinerariifolium]